MNVLGGAILLAALLILGGLAYKVASATPSSEEGADGGSGHPNTPRKQ
jgi:hypothetical protein